MVQPLGATPNQGVIRVGTISLTQDDPDYPAVDLMNYTLGGGSFSSRITQVVRTDQGLAYTANSSVGADLHYPGAFAGFTQTKNSTVVFAAQLIMNEIERMYNGDVTEKDLRFAKSARVNAFPSMFSTVFGNVASFARLELEGRPRDYYDTYLDRYRKVTVADIKRVAKKYLQPDKMVVLVDRLHRRVQGGRGQVAAEPGRHRRDGREVRRPDDGRPGQEARRRDGARRRAEVARQSVSRSVGSGQAVCHA